jgi:prepilin-type N-terminal cleavage/methylation domain-containing protein
LSGKRNYLSIGFTLIELLVTMGIIAILVSIAIPSYKAFRRKAEKAVCLSQMRTIHVALDNHIQDKNYWPQMPKGVFDSTEETDFWKWWILTLEPYGAGESVWLCPSDKVRREAKEEYNGSYMPAQFDDHHFTPYRWAGQPWLVERGDLHKKGAHIMMPDGSIHSSQDAY